MTDAIPGLSGDPETIANTVGAIAADKYLSLVTPAGVTPDKLRYIQISGWFADQIQPRLEALPGYQ